MDDRLDTAVRAAASLTATQEGCKVVSAARHGSPTGADQDRVEGVAEPRRLRAYLNGDGVPATIYAGGAGWIFDGGWRAILDCPPDDPPALDHPLWCLEALLGARDAEQGGREHVRGVSCTRYVLTIDLCTADAALPNGINTPSGHRFRDLRRLRGEVWIDGNGLLRRTSYRDGAAWHTTEMWDFGQPVVIELPPPVR